MIRNLSGCPAPPPSLRSPHRHSLSSVPVALQAGDANTWRPSRAYLHRSRSLAQRRSAPWTDSSSGAAAQYDVSPSASAPSVQPGYSPANIAVIARNQQMRYMIGTRLALLGHQSLLATDEVEARKLLRQSTPQLILIDADLPHFDGYSVFERVRHLSRSPMVIMIDPDDMLSPTVHRPVELGVVEYLIKPFTCKRLEDVVHAALHYWRAAAAAAEAPAQGSAQGAPRGSARPRSKPFAFHGLVVNPLLQKLHLPKGGGAVEGEVVAGEPLPFTAMEAALLMRLINHAGTIVSWDELLTDVCGDGEGGMVTSKTTLRGHMHRIRTKLKAYGCSEFTIRAVRSRGYMVD